MDKFIKDNYDVIRYCIENQTYDSNHMLVKIPNDYVIDRIVIDDSENKILIDIYHTKAKPKDYIECNDNKHPSPHENGYLYSIQKIIKISDIILHKRKLLINKIKNYE